MRERKKKLYAVVKSVSQASLSTYLNSADYYSQSFPSYIKAGTLGWKFPENCPFFLNRINPHHLPLNIYISVRQSYFALHRSHPIVFLCDINIPTEIQSTTAEPKSDATSQLVVSLYESVKWTFRITPSSRPFLDTQFLKNSLRQPSEYPLTRASVVTNKRDF